MAVDGIYIYIYIYVDAVVESERNPVNKHQIEPEYEE